LNPSERFAPSAARLLVDGARAELRQRDPQFVVGDRRGQRCSALARRFARRRGARCG